VKRWLRAWSRLGLVVPLVAAMLLGVGGVASAGAAGALVRAGTTDREELAILTVWTARAVGTLNLCHWARRAEAGPCELAKDPDDDSRRDENSGAFPV